jgi:hypothetical protein
MLQMCDVVKEVKKLAAEKPMNKYHKPPGVAMICSYHRGRCTDGSVGCIFGQVLVRLGHPIGGDGGIAHMLSMMGLDLFDEASDWCQDVQKYQDSGMEWGDAVKRASGSHPHPEITPAVLRYATGKKETVA